MTRTILRFNHNMANLAAFFSPLKKKKNRAGKEHETQPLFFFFKSTH